GARRTRLLIVVGLVGLIEVGVLLESRKISTPEGRPPFISTPLTVVLLASPKYRSAKPPGFAMVHCSIMWVPVGSTSLDVQVTPPGGDSVGPPVRSNARACRPITRNVSSARMAGPERRGADARQRG